MAQKEKISLNQLLNHLIERGLASLKYQSQTVDISRIIQAIMFQNMSHWYKPECKFDQMEIGIISHGSSISEKAVDYKQSVC